MSKKESNKYKSKRFRKEHVGKAKISKRADVAVKVNVNGAKIDNRQLRSDLTKIFVLTMLAVGLEVALKLLWR